MSRSNAGTSDASADASGSAVRKRSRTRTRRRSAVPTSVWLVIGLVVFAAAAVVPAMVQGGGISMEGGSLSWGERDYGYYQQRQYDSQRTFSWGENPGMRARDGVVYNREAYNAGPRWDNAREAAARAEQNYRSFLSAQARRNSYEGFDGDVWDTPVTPTTPLDADSSAPPINGDPIPLGYGYSDRYERLQKNPYTDALRAEYGWAATPPTAQYGYGSGSYPTRSFAPLSTRTARTRARKGELRSLSEKRLAATRDGKKALVSYLDGYREGCRFIVGTGGTVGIDGERYTLSDCLLNEPDTRKAGDEAGVASYRLGFRTACQVMFAGASTGVIMRGSIDVTHGECEVEADRVRPDGDQEPSSR